MRDQGSRLGDAFLWYLSVGMDDGREGLGEVNDREEAANVWLIALTSCVCELCSTSHRTLIFEGLCRCYPSISRAKRYLQSRRQPRGVAAANVHGERAFS